MQMRRSTNVLEVCLCSIEFQVLGPFNEATAVLNHFLQADSGPLGGSNRSFSPGRVNHLVAFTSVLVDLLDTSSTATLNRHHIRLPRKQLFILQVCQGDILRLFYQSIKSEEEFGWFDIRDSTMIANEEQRVRG